LLGYGDICFDQAREIRKQSTSSLKNELKLFGVAPGI
jgi:hypothetical protein